MQRIKVAHHHYFALALMLDVNGPTIISISVTFTSVAQDHVITVSDVTLIANPRGVRWMTNITSFILCFLIFTKNCNVDTHVAFPCACFIKI